MDVRNFETPVSNCWLEIDCRAVKANLDALRSKTKSRLMAVVKHNGYGLSLLEYARLLTDLGVCELAAGTYEEAVALRDGGIDASILLLTPQASSANVVELMKRGVMLTVGSRAQAEAVRRAANETGLMPQIHIKLDTGLGRYGFQPEDLRYVPDAVQDMDIRGMYTHFSSPYSSERTTRRQYEAFARAVEQLEANHVSAETLHCCASGGLLNYPQMHLDMVRAGSALLGRVPNAHEHGLTPAVYLKAPVMAVKAARSSSGIGYGRAVGLKRSACVGVLSVGCASGLPAPRSMAGLMRRKQYAVVNNRRVEILGALGIGALAVDLTGIRCGEGDIARLEVNPLYCAANIERVYDRAESASAASLVKRCAAHAGAAAETGPVRLPEMATRP